MSNAHARHVKRCASAIVCGRQAFSRFCTKKQQKPFQLLLFCMQYILTQQRSVVDKFAAAGNGEFLQQVINRQLCFFFPFDVKYHPAVSHHDKPVSMHNGVLHVVRHH